MDLLLLPAAFSSGRHASSFFLCAPIPTPKCQHWVISTAGKGLTFDGLVLPPVGDVILNTIVGPMSVDWEQ